MYRLGILPIIIRLTHANVWESMGKSCSCTQFIKAVFLLQVMRESVSVLQVMWQSVSGTISHVCLSERAMKSKVRMIIIITIVPSYIGKKYHSFVAVGTLVTIQMATNSWYFPVKLCTMVILINTQSLNKIYSARLFLLLVYPIHVQSVIWMNKDHCFVFVLSCRTKTRLLEKAMDMRTRVKLMLHFISIMKVQYYIVALSSAHHTSTNHVVRLIR